MMDYISFEQLCLGDLQVDAYIFSAKNQRTLFTLIYRQRLGFFDSNYKIGLFLPAPHNDIIGYFL